MKATAMAQEYSRTREETVVLDSSHSPATTKNDYETKKVIFRSYQIVWYIVGLIEVLLGFRVVLLLFGADSNSGFANLIYSMSDPLASPFAGIFGVTRTSGAVFEWSTLIAMMVYAIVAYGIVAIFQLVKPTNRTEVEGTVDNQ